jgi:ribosome-associated heat shock protein Hsp15
MSAKDTEDDNHVRIDKWLWAARFFKTRSLAAEAVNGGKVDLNGTRVKPSREVRLGDQISIRRGPYEWSVIVKGVAQRRGPAHEASFLYEETEASKETRERIASQMRFERPPEFDIPDRPSKKDRRALARFIKRGW